jgi:uncharacterized membrane protein (DUF4010 family)
VDEQLVILRSLGIAILIGALIGLEREYHYRLKGEHGFAGLRTFMFFSVLGNLATWISFRTHPIVLPIGFIGLIFLLSVTHFRGAAKERDRGMTTEVAALLTFLLGCLVAVGEIVVAVALGVVIAALLSAKPTFLRWVEKLTPEDIYTTLKFAVITFVVLPILPDRAYGPLGAFNPHEIWIMVVLIAGVSFLGYVALKLLGADRGVALSGLLGGLASSTAVAVSFSRRSRENPALAESCALAIVVASTVMVGRIGALVGIVFPALFQVLWLPLVVMGGAGLGASLWLWRGTRSAVVEAHDLQVRNPFGLNSVLTFGIAYALVLFLVKVVREFLPDGSAGIVAVVSGLTQVDAITLSLAKLAREDMPMRLAVAAMVIAALSNTVSKAMIGVSMGHRTLHKPLLLGLGPAFLGGLLVLTFLYVG